MSLPSRWVDALFAKLTVTYGQEFLRRWEGVPMDTVKADWAAELAGYENRPEAIKYALGNLPLDKPPTVLQFRELCRRAPVRGLPALPPPNPDSEVTKRCVAALKAIRSRHFGAVGQASNEAKEAKQ